MQAADLKQRIRDHVSMGWMIFALGGVLVLVSLVLGSEHRDGAFLGCVVALLGASVVRSTTLLRELADRVPDAEEPGRVRD